MLWNQCRNTHSALMLTLSLVSCMKCPLDSSLRIIICLLKIPVTNATRVSSHISLAVYLRFLSDDMKMMHQMTLSDVCVMVIKLLTASLVSLWQSLLEPFSKLLSFVLQYGVFSLSYLVEICGLCYKTFSKVNKPSCQ